MTPRSRRRVLAAAGTLTLAALAVAVADVLDFALRPADRVTGWTLLGLCALLAAYNVRKRLSFLPLGSSTAWLRLHAWGGLLAVALFLVHTGVGLPEGPLEILLAALFVSVAASGVVGLAMSRVLPSRLAERGEEVLYERIPQLRRRLGDEATRTVLEIAERTGVTTLAQFHEQRLAPYFACAPPLLPWTPAEPQRVLLDELASLHRYLDDAERVAARRLGELIQAKGDLDFHQARQGRLKGWLFVHVGLTWSLLLVGLVHGLLGQAFSGALR